MPSILPLIHVNFVLSIITSTQINNVHSFPMSNKYPTVDTMSQQLFVRNVKIKPFWREIKNLVLNSVKKINLLSIVKSMFFAKVMFMKLTAEYVLPILDFMKVFVSNVLKMSKIVIFVIIMMIIYVMSVWPNSTSWPMVLVLLLMKLMIIWMKILQYKKHGNIFRMEFILFGLHFCYSFTFFK